MYSDIYPEYKDCPICERPISILKRITDNYYTVEKLKELYQKQDNNSSDKLTQKIVTSYKRQTDNKLKKIMKNVETKDTNFNNVLLFLQSIKDLIGTRLVNELKNSDSSYTLELATIFTKKDVEQIKKLRSEDIILEIAQNCKRKKTILSFWSDNVELER